MTVRPRTNYLLDVVILGLFVVVLVSGLLLWWVYPHGGTQGGFRGGRGSERSSASVETSTLLGLTRHDMDAIHDWGGLLMGVLVLVHVVFHWKWIVCQTKRLFGGNRSRSSRRTRCPEA